MRRTVALTLVEAAPARLVRCRSAYAASLCRASTPFGTLSATARRCSRRSESGNHARSRASSATRAASAPAARSPTRRAAAREPARPRARPRAATRSRSRPRSATARPSSPSTLPVAERTRRGRCRRSVQIVWDASGSGAQPPVRSRAQALLDAYFRRAGDSEVTLVASPTSRSARRALQRPPRRLVGPAPRLADDGVRRRQQPRRGRVTTASRPRPLWFSDGLANYGAPWRLSFPVPVFAISQHRRAAIWRRCARSCRGERRAQHRPAGADARAGDLDAALARHPSWSRQSARRPGHRRPVAPRGRRPAGARRACMTASASRAARCACAAATAR